MTNKSLNKLTLGKSIILFFLFTGAILILLPLLWMLYSGFKSNSELFIDPWGFPKQLLFKNFILAWEAGIGKYFFNSVVVTISVIALNVSIGILTAYPLARFQFSGRSNWLYLIVGGLMLAPQVGIIPLNNILRAIHLYNTYWAMILTYTAYRLPFTVFLFWSYFESIPKELEEAAIIDGCGSFGVLLNVIVPVSKPMIGTSILLVMRYAWNEFLFALIFIEDTSKKTIPVGLAGMKSQADTDWTVLLAGLTLASLPIVMLYLILQKSMQRGITAGAVKG